MVSKEASSPQEVQQDNSAAKNCVKRKRSSGAHSSLKRQRVSLEGSRGEENFKTVERPLSQTAEGAPITEHMSVEGVVEASLPVRMIVPVSTAAEVASRERGRRSRGRQAAVAARVLSADQAFNSFSFAGAEGRKENIPPTALTRTASPFRPIAPRPTPVTTSALAATRATREITRESSKEAAKPAPKAATARRAPQRAAAVSMSVAAISAVVNKAARAPSTKNIGSSCKLVRIEPATAEKSGVASAPARSNCTPKRRSSTAAGQQPNAPSPISRPDEHLAAAVLQGLAPEAVLRKHKGLAGAPSARKALVERKQRPGTISNVQRTTNKNQTETVTITITRPLSKLASMQQRREGAGSASQAAAPRPVGGGGCLQPVAALGSNQQLSTGLSRFRMKTVKAGELSTKGTSSKCLTYVFR